jgi:hypothetical protein
MFLIRILILDRSCLLTWAYSISERLGLRTFQFLSCSGAVTSDVMNKQIPKLEVNTQKKAYNIFQPPQYLTQDNRKRMNGLVDSVNAQLVSIIPYLSLSVMFYGTWRLTS